MAAFRTHLVSGMISGTAVAYCGIIYFDLNPVQAFATILLGATGSVLPDFDSNSSRPLSFLFNTLSILVPAFLFANISRHIDFSPELIVTYFVCGYFLVRFILRSILKKITTHRGIMHSIPFAMLAGEAVYGVFIQSGRNMATLAGLSVMAGYIMHLVLDEASSIYFRFGFMPSLKKSSGRSLRLYSDSLLATFLVYGLVILLPLLALSMNDNRLSISFSAGWLP